MAIMRKPRVERVLRTRHHEAAADNPNVTAIGGRNALAETSQSQLTAREEGTAPARSKEWDSGQRRDVADAPMRIGRAPNGEKQLIWISTTEASQLTGVPKTSVLRAIKNDRIVARKGKGGRWQIHRASLLNAFAPNSQTNASANASSRPDSGEGAAQTRKGSEIASVGHIAVPKGRVAPNNTTETSGRSTLVWISTTDASLLTGVSKATVLRAIKRGRIVAHKDEGDRWRIHRASLLSAFPANARQAPHAAAPPGPASGGDTIRALKRIGTTNTSHVSIPEDGATLDHAAKEPAKPVRGLKRAIKFERDHGPEDEANPRTVDAAEVLRAHPVDKDATRRIAPGSVDLVGAATSGLEGAGGRSVEDDLRTFFLVLRRRYLVLLAVIAVVLAATLASLPLISVRYTAEALIQINPAKNIVDFQTVVANLYTEANAIGGEAEALRSRGLARATILATGIADDSDFAPEEPGFVATLEGAVLPRPQVIPSAPALSPGYLPGVGTPDSLGASLPVELVDSFLESLRVSQVGDTNILAVKYVDEEPRLTALVVNKLSDLYIEQQLRAKDEATRGASAALNERLETLKSAVEQSEREIEQLRSQVGLVDGRDVPLLMEQVSRINEELTLERRALAEARTRMEEIRRRTDASDVLSVAEVLNSPSVQSLRKRSNEIAQRRAQSAEELGPRHPVMLALVAEQAEIEQEIGREVDRVVANLEAETRIAEARVKSLEDELHEREQTVIEANRTGLQMRTLEREAEANRSLYRQFLERAKETAVQDGLLLADARIISYADVPSQPSQPNKKLILALATLAAGMLGVACAFVVDRFDNVGFGTSDQLERTSGCAVLGIVPALGRGGRKDPLKYMLKKPNSEYTESIRAIHTSLLLGERRSRMTIAVASSLSAEGKTTLSISFARMLAFGGRRVLLIDCDMRRARIHRRLGFANDVGLKEFLAGETQQIPLRSLMVKDPASPAMVIPAGSKTVSSAELLLSTKMSELLDTLREGFDIIVLDSPPILPIVDGRVIASMADSTLFLVKWRKTPRDAVGRALKQLREAGATLSGCVMMHVDMKQYAQSTYGTTYYDESYRKYFSE